MTPEDRTALIAAGHDPDDWHVQLSHIRVRLVLAEYRARVIPARYPWTLTP